MGVLCHAANSEEARYGAMMRQRLSRANKKVLQLEIQVTRLTQTKSLRGRLSQEWILRMLMSAPQCSGRALAHAFHMAFEYE